MVWGGSDSCQGDSGGPLYTMESDGRAVLVGLVGFLNCFNRRHFLTCQDVIVLAEHFIASDLALIR